MVNEFQQTGNAIRALCQNSVILRIELCLNSEYFSIRKDDFSSDHAIFHLIQKNFGPFLFCFCNSVRCCLQVILKGNKWKSSLTMVLTVFSSIFNSLTVFLIDRLEFLLTCSRIALILDGVQDVCRRSHLGRSSDVPSSL